MSVDSDSPKSSARSSRESRESPRKSIPRRSRIVASIDSARRRFSLQHSNDDYHQMQATALRDKDRLDVGSLPDFYEKAPPRSPQTKRVSLVAGGDKTIFVHKNRKTHASKACRAVSARDCFTTVIR
ncbi:hypothetical protein V3C99_008479, partial [Haemonchus contortus]